jgi:hypothetical protein
MNNKNPQPKRLGVFIIQRGSVRTVGEFDNFSGERNWTDRREARRGLPQEGAASISSPPP